MTWTTTNFLAIHNAAARSRGDTIQQPTITTTIASPDGSDYYTTGVAVGTLGGARRLVFGSGKNLALSAPYEGTLSCVEMDGTPVWTYNSPNNDFVMGVDIGDVDNDGANEVAAGFRLQDHIGVLLDADGNLIWSYDMGEGNYVRGVKIGELRSDHPGKEVVFAGAGAKLALVSADGNEIWATTLTDPYYATVQWVWIADADADGQAEIYVACGASVRRHRASDGAEVWRTTIGGNNNYCYGVAAGHITSMTTQQIVSASEESGVFVLDADGNEVWSAAGGKGADNAVYVSDIDGDGYDEVFVTHGVENSVPGGVRIYDHDGKRLGQIYLPAHAQLVTYNAGDIVVTCDDGNVYIASVM